jgi:hypothetical protein
MTTATTALSVIEIAESYAHQSPSAALCLADARICYITGDHRNACRRALKSLAFSVSMFDAEYIRASALVKEAA